MVLRCQASEWSDILSGSVLFVLYINDIDDTVNSKILKFADDTKIYNRADSVEGIERMRADLRNLVVWSKEWQMLFNVEKCKVMHLKVNYVMDATQLQVVSEERDLGIIVSDDLKLVKTVLLQLNKQTRYLE